MKKLLLIGALIMVVLIPLTVQVAFSDPGIAPGVLAHVYYSDGSLVPYIDPGGDGRRWIVVPGGSYKVHLTDIELADGTTTVWIKGTTNMGVPWTIQLTNQVVSGGEIMTDPFRIPSNAGCTIVVAYWEPGHLAHDPIQTNAPGHMKTYYNDIPPHEDSEAVPCEASGVPEFPFGSAIVVSLGLLAAYAVRRRQKMH